ncbi:MAG: hypothetical protein PF447_10250 [Spirochaetaceae bacterium]|jgi:hypothetical protein|nr:hypothetical protein [Spirochaetaceae bacterium]
MARTNYSYAKRQQEIKRQKKKQEKLQRKIQKKNAMDEGVESVDPYLADLMGMQDEPTESSEEEQSSEENTSETESKDTE